MVVGFYFSINMEECILFFRLELEIELLLTRDLAKLFPDTIWITKLYKTYSLQNKLCKDAYIDLSPKDRAFHTHHKIPSGHF
jgi:hypothetical protein